MCCWPKLWTVPLTGPWNPHQSSSSKCKTSMTIHLCFPVGPTMPRCPRCLTLVSTPALDAPAYLGLFLHLLWLSALEFISLNSASFTSGVPQSTLPFWPCCC